MSTILHTDKGCGGKTTECSFFLKIVKTGFLFNLSKCTLNNLNIYVRKIAGNGVRVSYVSRGTVQAVMGIGRFLFPLADIVQ